MTEVASDDPYTAGPTGPGLAESVWRYRVPVLAIVVAFGIAVLGMSLLLPTRYEATAQMVLTDPQSSGIEATDALSASASARRTSKQALFVRSGPILAETVDRLGGDWTVEDLRDAIEVTADPDAEAVIVTASASSADEAATVANTAVESYRATVAANGDRAFARALEALETTSEELQAIIADSEGRLATDPEDRVAAADLEGATDQLRTVRTRARDTTNQAALSSDGVQFVESAIAPRSAASPRPLRNVLAAVLLAFLVAGPVSWMKADRNRRITEAGEPSKALDVPLLGEIPRSPRSRGAHHHLDALPSVVYDYAAMNLERNLESATILITSAQRGDGTTTSAMNLAAAFVRGGRRVALVDGDAHERSLTHLLCDPRHPGLTDLASGTARPQDCQVNIEFAGGQLAFVPNGSPAGGIGLLYRSAQMRRALQRLRAEFDVVIVDTACLMASSDTVSLIDAEVTVVLVVRHKTPVAIFDEAKQRLEVVGARIGGYLFTFSEAASTHEDADRDPPRELPADSHRRVETAAPERTSRSASTHRAVRRGWSGPWVARSRRAHP